MAISRTKGKGRRGAARPKLIRPRPVDAHVGARVRLRRTMLGMSQEKLAEALGLTFQQVQKYEHGANRIGSSRLYELSKILDVSIQFFFDEMPAEIAATARGGGGSGHARKAVFDYEPDTLAKRETLELVRAYYKIRHPKVRKKVFDLAKALAKSVDTD